MDLLELMLIEKTNARECNARDQIEDEEEIVGLGRGDTVETFVEGSTVDLVDSKGEEDCQDAEHSIVWVQTYHITDHWK